MRNLIQFFKPLLLYSKFLWIFEITVNCHAIGFYDRCCIMYTFHTSFYLQAFNAAFNDIRKIRQQTHILGIKNVSSTLILHNRKILSGTFFFHKGVFPPARLCAASTVCISSSHVIAHETPSRIGNAHGSMYEHFQLHITFLPDFPYFLQGHLPCQDNPRRS